MHNYGSVYTLLGSFIRLMQIEGIRSQRVSIASKLSDELISMGNRRNPRDYLSTFHIYIYYKSFQHQKIYQLTSRTTSNTYRKRVLKECVQEIEGQEYVRSIFKSSVIYIYQLLGTNLQESSL